MSEEQIVLIPAPKSPEGALAVEVQIDEEMWGDPRFQDLMATFRRALQEIGIAGGVLADHIFGHHTLSALPPLPFAQSLTLSEIASLAKTIEEVIISEGRNLEKYTNREEMARFISVLMVFAFRLYTALARAAGRYMSTVAQSLSPVEEANRYAESIATGMTPYITRGVAEVQREQAAEVK